MRHSYIDGPRRIRAPRATPRSRVRFLPAIVALPAVAALWLTVGLPVLSQVTSAGAGNRAARTVVFSTEAGGGGSGGSAGGAAGPQTVAAATVSNQVLAAYHEEEAQAWARARAKTHAKAKAASPTLPQPTLPSPASGTATLATAETTNSPPPSQTSGSPPAKDKSPGTGSSGGSGGSGGATSPGSGGTGTTPAPDPAPGNNGGSGDTSGSGSGGSADTGDTGDIGGSGGAGGGTPAPPPPPPPPPPLPPPPPPPPGSLTPQDIQTTNGGTRSGEVEQSDTVTFTFSGAVNPSQILAGWNGSATAVTVRMTPSSTRNDGMTVLDGFGNQISALGSVNLHGHYLSAITLFTGSTMTVSGNTVTIVLGTRSHGVPVENSLSTMVWTTPNGNATESGPADVDF
jgi:hypothetical protein